MQTTSTCIAAWLRHYTALPGPLTRWKYSENSTSGLTTSWGSGRQQPASNGGSGGRPSTSSATTARSAVAARSPVCQADQSHTRKLGASASASSQCVVWRSTDLGRRTRRRTPQNGPVQPRRWERCRSLATRGDLLPVLAVPVTQTGPSAGHAPGVVAEGRVGSCQFSERAGLSNCAWSSVCSCHDFRTALVTVCPAHRH